MMGSRSVENYLVSSLLETLQELPDTRAHVLVQQDRPTADDQYSDAIVQLEVANKTVKLLIETKKSVYPRDIREALWRIRRYSTMLNTGTESTEFLPLLAADAISIGAREILRKERVAFFDSGGSLFVPAPGAFIYIEKAVPKKFEKQVRSLFSKKRSQVLHTLLLNPYEWFGVEPLANLARVSPSTASSTLIELERFDWLESRGRGPSKERRLVEPGTLLSEWANSARSGERPRYRRYYVASLAADEIMLRIDRICEVNGTLYAITQETGAQLYAPFLSTGPQVKARMQTGKGSDEVLSALGARPVSEGANLTFIDTGTDSAFLFRERWGQVWLASPVQVYLDLMFSEGRAEEMAKHLRQERLGF